MGTTNFPNGVTSFGIPLMGGGGIPAMYGNVFFVDYRNGSDGNKGMSTNNAVKTLSKAYSLATSNNNDVILIDGDSEILEDAMITWSKNRIHVVGLGGGFISGQRSRINLSATGITSVSAATITVSGVGNSFSNLKVINTGTDATSVAALIDAGEANVYNNCSFMKFSDLGVATVADVICRSDSTTYLDCEIGFDTLLQTVARPSLWIKASGGTRCKHLMMKRCHFTCASSESDKAFILVADTSSLAFSNTFIDCSFNAALVSSISAATLDNAVDSAASLAEGNLLFIRPVANTSAFCNTVTDQVQVIGPLSHEDTGRPITPS
jgi:hypothetical protein